SAASARPAGHRRRTSPPGVAPQRGFHGSGSFSGGQRVRRRPWRVTGSTGRINWVKLFDRNYAGQDRYVNMLDLKKPSSQQAAMEAFFFAYQAFTAKPDEMLARRGL